MTREEVQSRFRDQIAGIMRRRGIEQVEFSFAFTRDGLFTSFASVGDGCIGVLPGEVFVELQQTVTDLMGRFGGVMLGDALDTLCGSMRVVLHGKHGDVTYGERGVTFLDAIGQRCV